jgi:hypothetical protein
MRKAFKVATAFTGAAVGAVAFTPTAMAAPTEPDNGPYNCAAGYNTSVHLYWNASEHHGPTCFGNHTFYSGFAGPPNGPRYDSLCPGNNIGQFASVSVNRNLVGLFPFGAGNGPTRAFGLHGEWAISIQINSWTGSHMCLG